jgi:hypothetical protein
MRKMEEEQINKLEEMYQHSPADCSSLPWTKLANGKRCLQHSRMDSCRHGGVASADGGETEEEEVVVQCNCQGLARLIRLTVTNSCPDPLDLAKTGNGPLWPMRCASPMQWRCIGTRSIC